MKKSIKRKMYDTETAKQLNFKHVGEFGEAHGYEERLYITKTNLYFIYGVGGPESPYPQETIKPITKEEADAWETDASADKKADKPKKSGKGNDKKTKTPAKKAPTAKKIEKVAKPAKDTAVAEVSKEIEPVKEAEIKKAENADSKK